VTCNIYFIAMTEQTELLSREWA